MSTDVDVAVVGAGMAGLTAASELARAGLDVRVFEARDQVGGRMAGFRHDGYTVDAGAEQISTLGYRATWELLRAYGVPASDVPPLGSGIGMWRDGRVHPGVAGRLGPLARAGLSARGRASLAGFLGSASRRAREFDTDHPEDTPFGTATVAEVLRGRHPDVHDYLFAPIAGTFFGWDTARSAAAPMVSLMLEIGDSTRWRTYVGGMDMLARRMAQRLPVQLGAEVTGVVADGTGARLELASGSGASSGTSTVTARSLLLCVPAPVALALHANPSPAEREFLSACTFTPALKVSCLLDRPLAPRADRPVYLLLVPQVEDGVLSCVIVDHVKHPDRAPRGRGLLSLMAAAHTVPGLLDEPDEVVVDRLTGAAARYVPGLDRALVGTFVHRFRHALPEATPAALRGRAAFADRPPGPVDYAGDWITLRPSSEGAVRAGAVAASRTLARLSGTRRKVAA